MIIEVIKHTLMITSFVFLMMLLIDYLNVFSRGKWERTLQGHRWSQYLLSSFLGATPGCLGAFAVVSLYIHRVISVGALVAVMIATSGDGAFVMLALFPGKACLLFGILLVVGFCSGVLVDQIPFLQKIVARDSCPTDLTGHENNEPYCDCFRRDEIVKQWKNCSPHRGVLTIGLLLFLLGVVTGELGHGEWNWIRWTLVITGSVGVFIVSTVPDHFLEEHLWNHLVKRHVWRIFLWTFGALLLMHLLTDRLHLEGLIRENRFALLAIACLIGIIPESGPHLIFVTMYVGGMIPFSILLASSIVQDGHGMLPVLAHSRRTFFAVKGINLFIGFFIGLIGYFMAW